MTKFILTILCCAVIATSIAQPSLNAASVNGATNEEAVNLPKQDMFSSVNYSIKNNMLSFSGLPSDKHLRVYITNADGVEEYNKKLNAESNSIDTKKLGKGLHYVTIISRDDKRKAFVLNL